MLRTNQYTIVGMVMRPIVVTLLVFVCFVAKADDNTKQPYQLESVSIVEKRPLRAVALTYSVLDSTQIEESANSSLAELLTKHSPIFVKTYGLGSAATVMFRGTNASHTRVEWNGLSINNPMLGDFDFSLVPVWFADRIELYHGASSLQTGGGALGGTVAINSTPRWDRKFYGDVVQGVGSYGLYQGYVSAGGGGGKLQGRVRYMYERAENNFTFKNTSILGHPELRQKNADYNKHGATADLHWNAGRGNVFSLMTWLSIADRNIPPKMADTKFDNRVESTQNDDFRVAVSWGKYGKRTRSRLVSGYQYMLIDYVDNNIKQVVLIASTKSTVNSLLNSYNFEFEISQMSLLRVRANLDYHSARVFDRKGASENSPDRLEAGVSLSFHHQFNNHFSGFALLRGELSDSDLEPLMPSIGFEYKPLVNDDLRLTINGARHYHRPTLNELYWKPGGNENLRSEKGYTADLSLHYHKSIGRMEYKLSAAGYMSWITDWIVWEERLSANYSTPINSKKVFARGVELYGAVGYRQGDFNFTVSTNYAYTRSTNEKVYSDRDESKGKQLVYVPLHKASVMLDGAYRKWYVWWVWSVVSERFVTASNEKILENLPACDIHDITVGRKIPLGGVRLDAQFKVNNLFGRVYRALPSRPMPKQYFTFLLKVSF